MSNSPHLQPYPLTKNGKDFQFVTDSGFVYEIYKTLGADYLPDASFSRYIEMFGFKPYMVEQSTKLPVDNRIHPTIIHAINLYFEQEPNLILVYVCDMMDGRQRQRNGLFDRWFNEFGKGYCKLSYTDNTYTYCALIYREGHPDADELTEAVAYYIQEKEDD